MMLIDALHRARDSGPTEADLAILDALIVALEDERLIELLEAGAVGELRIGNEMTTSSHDAAAHAPLGATRTMNHKRGRPKDRRAGCLMCKPHKSNGSKDRRVDQTWQEKRAMDATEEQVAEVVGDDARLRDGLPIDEDLPTPWVMAP